MFRLFTPILHLCMGALLLVGCARPPTDLSQREVERGLTRSERYLASQRPAATLGQGDTTELPNRPVALVEGEPVGYEQLLVPLSEISGGVILEEIVLDRKLAAEFESRGLALDAEQVRAEEQLLLDTLTRTALAPTDAQAQELLEILRARRGLGAYRYRRLLERNAALRALVADQVTLSRADLDQSYQLRYGPRLRARLLIVATAREAQDAMARLRAGEAFSNVASEVSTDASRDRGGLLPPISLADTSFPSAIRSALRELDAGETSPVIAMGASYAIVKLDSVVPPPAGRPASMDEAREHVERDARLYQERVLMDDLARELVESANVTILDPSLNRSWQRRLSGADQ